MYYRDALALCHLRGRALMREKPPTISELAELLRVSPVSAKHTLDRLVVAGFVDRDPVKARAIRIVTKRLDDRRGRVAV